MNFLPPPTTNNIRTEKSLMNYEQERGQYDAQIPFYSESEWNENNNTMFEILQEVNPGVSPVKVREFMQSKMKYPLHIRDQQDFRRDYQELLPYNKAMIEEFETFLNSPNQDNERNYDVYNPTQFSSQTQQSNNSNHSNHSNHMDFSRPQETQNTNQRDEISKRLMEMEQDFKTMGGMKDKPTHIDFSDKQTFIPEGKRVSFNDLLEERKQEEKIFQPQPKDTQTQELQQVSQQTNTQTILNPHDLTPPPNTNTIIDNMNNDLNQIKQLEKELTTSQSNTQITPLPSLLEYPETDDVSGNTQTETEENIHSNQETTTSSSPSSTQVIYDMNKFINPLIKNIQRGYVYQQQVMNTIQMLTDQQQKQNLTTSNAIREIYKQQNQQMKHMQNILLHNQTQSQGIYDFMKKQYNMKQEMDYMKQQLSKERQHMQRTIGTYIPNQEITETTTLEGSSTTYACVVSQKTHNFKVPNSSMIYIKHIHIPFIKLKQTLPNMNVDIEKYIDMMDMLEFQIQYESKWLKSNITQDTQQQPSQLQTHSHKERIRGFRKFCGNDYVSFSVNHILEKQSDLQNEYLRQQEKDSSSLEELKISIQCISPFSRGTYLELNATNQIFSIIDYNSINTQNIQHTETTTGYALKRMKYEHDIEMMKQQQSRIRTRTITNTNNTHTSGVKTLQMKKTENMRIMLLQNDFTDFNVGDTFQIISPILHKDDTKIMHLFEDMKYDILSVGYVDENMKLVSLNEGKYNCVLFEDVKQITQKLQFTKEKNYKIRNITKTPHISLEFHD